LAIYTRSVSLTDSQLHGVIKALMMPIRLARREKAQDRRKYLTNNSGLGAGATSEWVK
jgi:hypothetical protein